MMGYKRMEIFDKLKLSATTQPTIEWEMTPDLAFCTFSAKGLRDELANTSERVCYFFIDNWGEEPKLYLMERGIRYVHVLAEIKAPPAMLKQTIAGPTGAPAAKGNYPIDSTVKEWLQREVIETSESPYLIPTIEDKQDVEEEPYEVLPPRNPAIQQALISLPGSSKPLADDQIDPLIKQWNFFDSTRNQQGRFENSLADTGDTQTVIDEKTGVIWQRGGLDLVSHSKMKQTIANLNREGFAGFDDWRMPTLEEALSLMEPMPNARGLYLHPCFSKLQPFIFTATRRTPTGFWFVNYQQGKVYWSSGTVPGGFCRLCRRDNS